MLKVGTAEVDITPPVNVPLDGFENRTEGAAGVHDPLQAQALVVDDGRARIAWLTADLVGLPAVLTTAIREEAARRTGLPADHVMVSATHTHGGPSPHPAPQVSADHAAHGRWLEALPGLLADAIARAAGSAAPAELLVGRSLCATVAHNRRFHMRAGGVKMVWDNPKPEDVAYLDLTDPALQVLAIRRAGKLEGLLYQFACHPTVLVGDNRLVTADWPGVVRRELAAGLDRPGLWIAAAQGCCGDITPSPPRGTYAICEAKGAAIARTVRAALDAAEPLRGEIVGAARVPVALPRKREGLDPAPTGEVHHAAVCALRIGELAAVGLPGEPLVALGLAIKAPSPFPVTLAGGYTDDYDDALLGYIPPTSEYPQGGYEVTAARVMPGADRILLDAAVSALGALRSG